MKHPASPTPGAWIIAASLLAPFAGAATLEAIGGQDPPVRAQDPRKPARPEAPARGAAGPQAVLDHARTLVEKNYKDWTVGQDLKKKQISANRFVVSTVEAAIGRKLPKEAREEIMLKDVLAKAGELIDRKDPRLAGVQKALVGTLKVADAVTPDKALAGDFVQVWKKSESGQWYSHVAVIQAVFAAKDGSRRARLFGAHPTPRPSGSLGASKTFLTLKEGPEQLLFIARVKPDVLRKKAAGAAASPATGAKKNVKKDVPPSKPPPKKDDKKGAPKKKDGPPNNTPPKKDGPPSKIPPRKDDKKRPDGGSSE